MQAYGLVFTLDRIDVAACDLDTRRAEPVKLGVDPAAFPLLCIGGATVVENVCWGTRPDGEAADWRWTVFEDVVGDLCRLWHHPVRTLLQEELLKVALAHVPAGSLVLLTCSPQIPRAVRHGLFRSLQQQDYRCVPITDPWVVLSFDHWLGSTGMPDQPQRLALFTQGRRQLYVAIVACHFHAASVPLPRLECHLAYLFSGPLANGRGGRSPVRRLLRELPEPEARSHAVRAVGDARVHKAAASFARWAHIHPEQMWLCDREALAEAAARVAAAATGGSRSGFAVCWRRLHRVGFVAEDGSVRILLTTDLTESRDVDADVSWKKASGEPLLSLVDLPAAGGTTYIPIDEFWVADGAAEEKTARKLRLHTTSDGTGLVEVLDPEGKVERKSEFLLA